jgi:hypothetical protein
MNQRRRFPEQPTVIAGCFVWQSYFKQRDTLPRAPTGYFRPLAETSLSACRLFHAPKMEETVDFYVSDVCRLTD